jgi:Flp pilus assembly protein TadB
MTAIAEQGFGREVVTVQHEKMSANILSILPLHLAISVGVRSSTSRNVWLTRSAK